MGHPVGVNRVEPPERSLGACAVAWPLVAWVLLLASCSRPLGIWEAQQKKQPCEDMGGLDPDAPWPMAGRCPSRASFLPVKGPASPQVLWSVEAPDGWHGEAVVGGDEVVYALMADAELYGAVHALDRDGTVRWVLRLTDTPQLSDGHLALGRDGSVYATSPDEVVSLSRDGRVVHRYDLWGLGEGSSPQASSPVITAEGDVVVANGYGVLSFSAAGEYLWSAEAAFTGTIPLLAADGRVVVEQLKAYDLGYATSVLLGFDASGHSEDLARVSGSAKALAMDPEGDYLVASSEPGAQPPSIRLSRVSPAGELIWSRDSIRGAVDAWCALALDDRQRTRVTCSWTEFTNELVLTLVEPDGRIGWEQTLPGAGFRGQLIVDGEGTTYLAGLRYGDYPTPDQAMVWAIDAAGAVRWSLELPDDSARLFAMGRTGRLYVRTSGALVAVGDAGD